MQEKLSKYDAPQKAKALGVYPYFRKIESDQDTEVLINGKKVLMFGSNSYLGLTNHPKIKEAAIAAIRKYGTGCAGSRFLNGTLDIHEELEHRLAKFVGKEEAIILFNWISSQFGGSLLCYWTRRLYFMGRTRSCFDNRRSSFVFLYSGEISP